MVDNQRLLRAEYCRNRVQMSDSSADCWLLCEICVKGLMIDCLHNNSLLVKHCAHNRVHVVKSVDSLPARVIVCQRGQGVVKSVARVIVCQRGQGVV